MTPFRNLTDEQRAIARFWSDDPNCSRPTPPGHWIAIALQIFDRDQPECRVPRRHAGPLGLAMADSYHRLTGMPKYEFDLLRPITYIRAHIDPDWEPVLITPPFPGISERPQHLVRRRRRPRAHRRLRRRRLFLHRCDP